MIRLAAAALLGLATLPASADELGYEVGGELIWDEATDQGYMKPMSTAPSASNVSTAT